MHKNEKCLACTDSDLPFEAAVYATINYFNELEIEYCFTDDRHHEKNFTRKATVCKEDTITMARYLHTTVEELPKTLFESCGSAYCSSTSNAELIFQETLNTIIDTGVTYNLHDIK